MYLLVVDLPGGPLSRVGLQMEERFGWNVGHADNGRTCLTQLKQERWDVVLSARHLRDIDGLSLLTLVRIKQPAAVRVLLDRHADLQGEVGQQTAIAQRVLDAPPSAAQLRALLTAMNASPLTVPQEMREAIGAVAGLPSVHAVLIELRRVVQNPDVSAIDVTRVLEQEPMLAAKVLHLANAGFAGHSVAINDLGQAAALLGVETLQQVIIASAAFSAVSSMDVDPGVVEQAQRHGIAAARFAASRPTMPPHARTGALLIDVGLPLMALAWPDAHGDLREESIRRGQPLHELERERLGITHAEAGALLSRRWSLPTELGQMIAGHHLPPLSPVPDLRSIGFQVHHAVQTAVGNEGVDVYDVTVRDDVPAWV